MDIYDTVYKEIDYEGEAIELLIHIINKKSYLELKDSYHKKKDIMLRDKAFALIDQLDSIEKAIAVKINIEDPDMILFFKEFLLDDYCIAKLIYNTSLPLEEGLTKLQLRNKWLQKTKEFLLDDTKQFVITSNSLEVEQLSDGKGITLFERISNLDITDGEKWRLLHLCEHVEDYVDRLFQVLETVITMLKEYLTDLEELFQERVLYWEKYLETHKATDFIESALQFTNFTDKNFIIYPSIFACNKIFITAEDEKQAKYVLGIGMIFDSDFHLSAPGRNKEQLCNGLKLLSDNSKFEILQMIKESPAYGQEIAKELKLTTATISHHVNALLSYGFVNIDKVDNRIYYRMDKKVIEEFIEDLKLFLCQ